jgi:hypothetical protein
MKASWLLTLLSMGLSLIMGIFLTNISLGLIVMRWCATE